jgi:serine/threonine protein phosphatase 1
MLTYAIGDIHGCYDAMVALLDKIERHADGRDHRLVFLGDYIDRGPDSAAVLRTLQGLESASPGSVVCLMGNHEALLLMALLKPEAMPLWLRNGGLSTLASFGTRSPIGIDPEILAWINRLPTFHYDARRYYVHAGLRPGRPLPDQSDEDRIWIRDVFLDGDHDFGKHVVHGHTPLRNGLPEVRRHRTNLDTGAVYGGALTAGVFTEDEDAPVSFLSVR